MKKIILLSVIIISSCITSVAQNEIQKEQDLIKEVIQSAYVDGLCNNLDIQAINKGFHPGFILFSKGEGAMMWKYPLYNWIENAKEGEKKGFKYSFQNELTTIEFLFIDITETIATAKIKFYEGDKLKFIDYLSLIKFEDGWKIVSKMAYRLPPKK